MRVAREGRSSAITASTRSPIRMRCFAARSGSTCTPSASRRASSGERTLLRAIQFIWICGMTTLNTPERLSDLPRLPRDEGGPVFAEPWQAQAFALAVKLSEQGHFTWKEWAQGLAA